MPFKRLNIIAIIPAAGKGSRFGMPKVDASYNGITFAERIMATLADAGIGKYFLVRDVDTPDMLSSIRLGMERALAEFGRPDGWLIWPVDHPTVKAETVGALVKAFADRKNSIIIPRFNAKSGHPILLPGTTQLPEEPDPLGLKGIIIKSACPVHFINVQDEGILHNFNRPEDVVYV